MAIADNEEDNIFQLIEATLTKLGPLDIKYRIASTHPQLSKSVYHFAGASEFQTIDIDLQHRSRPVVLIEGIDDCIIIFDRNHSIKTTPSASKPTDWSAITERTKQFYALQKSNIIKNLNRNQLLEAKLYYDYLTQYTVKVIRRLQTPFKLDYGVKHAYRDLSPEAVKFLENILLIKTEADIRHGLDRLDQFIRSGFKL